jgi:hypothetical protein
MGVYVKYKANIKKSIMRCGFVIPLSGGVCKMQMRGLQTTSFRFYLVHTVMQQLDEVIQQAREEVCMDTQQVV